MKKYLLLLVILFVLVVTTVAQSGFRTSWFYAEKHEISYRPVSNINYSEWDQFGNVRYYNIWQKVIWHQRTGRQTFYTWRFVNGHYQWVSQYKFGTYWYYTWLNFKRYYYYNNGFKFYY